ncbi:MAG: cytochrome P450 [Burkholderiaceae bacterium]
MKGLPGPFAWPIIGNVLPFLTSPPHIVLERWAAEYGSAYRYQQGGASVVAISNQTLSKEILKARPKTFRRHQRLADVIESTGFRGVFTAEGVTWERQRRLIMRGLTPTVVNGVAGHIDTVVQRLAERWRIDATDPQADLKHFSMDVVMWASMGLDINCVDNPKQALSRSVDDWFKDISKQVRYPSALYAISERLTGNRGVNSRKVLRDAANDAINGARERHSADPTQSNILMALLRARLEPGTDFTDEDIIGNTATMLLAGQETTASAISWALYYLAKDTDYCGALRACVERMPRDSDTALGRRIPDEVQRFCNDVLRLRPVAPMLGLTTMEPVSLGGLRLEAGQKLVLLLREKDNRFGPKTLPRFIPLPPRPASSGAIYRDDSLAFGAGPRLCPGRYLAILEMMSVIAMVVCDFDISLDSSGSTDPSEGYSFSMHPERLPIRLTPRRPVLT